ncbi:DNA replication factor Cdt1 [Chionoecetes opilio]|uniref:DNA replication factor Cdt1 n=1 Tax=Chionoecetes opilio TaxID=41210 RepID=A0A8J4YWC0_CHIOP|nr:DNA replication factor Cdt1 [Chionoecetes opilio]
MASTQTSLGKYFKTKKSARAAHPLKGSIKSDGRENKTLLTQVPNVLKEEEQAVKTPPVTPKRKWENDEQTKRKRRREAEEEDDATQRTPRTPRTPKNRVSQAPQTTPRSARKRLIMTPQEEEGTKETDKNFAGSPSKQLKMDRAKLTTQEVKEMLGKCGRMDELRARLLKVNQCSEKLRQFRERKISGSESPSILSPRKAEHGIPLQKFSSIEIEIPISPRKAPMTPIKSPIKPPAYERYQHLVGKPDEELALPFKYWLVKEVFRAVDTVVSMLHNRQELITYSKLKPAVQQMLSRTFSEHYLGQIKSVFPLAYFFKQESIKNGISTGTGGVGKNAYHLTVKANLEYKPPAAQNLSMLFGSSSAPQTPKYRKMDSVVMVERRNIFHNRLIEQVKEYHEQFLQSLEPPISSAGMDIKRWHPEFPLEEVPEVEAAAIPQPPHVDKLDTARDVLEKAQALISANHRMEQAVLDAASKVPPMPESTPAPAPETPVQPVSVCAALRGISSSLLEKVRAREAAKRAREMTRSTKENKELEMLSRLPEIARIIRNSFVTEKKAALPWETVAAKVAASYSSMISSSEVDPHLHLLVEAVPGWCTVHKVRSGTFLKINKARELSSVEDKLQAVMKERQ